MSWHYTWQPRVVYMIRHNVTGRMYIGSTRDYETRIRSHLAALRRHAHSVEDMQKDFDEFGENYSIEVLGDVESDDTEYEYQSAYHSNIRGIGYNYKDKKWNDYKHGKIRY